MADKPGFDALIAAALANPASPDTLRALLAAPRNQAEREALIAFAAALCPDQVLHADLRARIGAVLANGGRAEAARAWRRTEKRTVPLHEAEIIDFAAARARRLQDEAAVQAV